MSRSLRAFGAYLRLALQAMFQYRGEIALWAVWGVVYPTVALVMWQAAAAHPKQGDTIGGFGPHQFAAYFILSMVVGHVSTAWDIYQMSYLVRTGRMSAKLLRPVLPIWESLADNVAYKILTLSILIPMWLLVAWWSNPAFTTTWMQFSLAVPAVILAAMLNYLLCYDLSLIAFWVVRMDGLGEIWFGASLFFGGRLAPVSILPEPLQWVAAVMPFKWVIWFPSAALMGNLEPAQIARGLAWQALWVAAALLFFRYFWRTSVKRYSAVGA